MLPPGAVVLCAVSGGADSMCLLHWLSQQKGVALHAGHFDHRLRGEESAGDAAFVREMCETWGVPFHLGSADVAAAAKEAGRGLEEAARQLRYAFLEQTAERVGAARVATAHTADDNAETLLLNLIRGTGLRGLTGIPPVRGSIVRPFLTTTRAEITAYLEELRIPHREDSTNTDETYARNRLRHQVMPVLRGLNAQAVSHMGSAARYLREIDEAMDREVQERLTFATVERDRVTFPLAELREAPEPLRPRMLQGLLDRLGAGRRDFGAVHLNAILTLKPGGHLDLPSGVAVEARMGTLTLEKRDQHYNPREK